MRQMRDSSAKAFSFKTPQDKISWGKYYARFAQNQEDIDKALKLRFEVFNLELKEGLQESFATQRDYDEFDDACHHLMVFNSENDEVVGTYRLQTYQMAQEQLGFYSQTEFDFDNIPEDILQDSVEVGRACIHKDFRNGRILGLLWKGIAKYMMFNEKRYLFGCCSLTSQDCDEAFDVWQYLNAKNVISKNVSVKPKKEYICFEEDRQESEFAPQTLPQLFQLYLNYNAKVCGPPAIDRQFKTIDFFVCMDIEEIDDKTRKFYFSS